MSKAGSQLSRTGIVDRFRGDNKHTSKKEAWDKLKVAFGDK